MDHPVSLSTSGYHDGLGLRSLIFDREQGVMLERLILRPELGAFEKALGARAARLAGMDERFARIRTVERDPDTGWLTVVSEFVAGNRLCDLIETAGTEIRDENAAPSVDVGLGYLIAILPALESLHTAGGMAHGAAGPGRVLITPSADVVLLDAIYAEALERLQFGRTRLWTEFGLGMPPGPGPARFDVAADLAQASLGAVALVVGRPLGLHEYPDGIAPLVVEVTEIAQIRGSDTFATALHRFLQRTLPLPGQRPYETAREALGELQRLAHAEMGAESCRKALASFVHEMSTAADPRLTCPFVPARSAAPERQATERPKPIAEPKPAPAAVKPKPVQPPVAAAAPKAVERPKTPPPPPKAAAPAAPTAARPPAAPPQPAKPAPAPPPARAVEPRPPAKRVEPPPPLAKPAAPIAAAPPAGAAPDRPPPVTIAAPPAPPPPPMVAAVPVPDPPPAPVPPPAPEPVVMASPKAKDAARKRHRGPRLRDKLRSIAAPEPPPLPPPPPPAPPTPPPPPPRPPLVAPTASTQYPAAPEPAWRPPPTPEAVAPPVPAAAYGATMPSAAPPIPMPFAAPMPPPSPIGLVPPAPVSRAPVSAPSVTSVPLSPLAAPTVSAPPIRLKSESSPALKIKSDPPIGFAPPRQSRPEPSIYDSRPMPHQPAGSDKSSFPWKLAAAVIIVMAIGVTAGRAYLPGRSFIVPLQPAPKTPAATLPTVAAVTGRGSIVVETQPAGAQVTLDGKPAGESPLRLDDVMPGRHVVMVSTSTASVKKVVRVDAGKTVSIDVPVFSGWVAIFSPIVLEISENGRSLGSTEDGKLMLPPGHHALTLTNRELGYSSQHGVDIEPGEERPLNIQPQGVLSLNAQPWAEVWIDGKRAGETPLANLRVALGTHDIVFKHPQFEERKMTVTVKASPATQVSIDFTKPSDY